MTTLHGGASSRRRPGSVRDNRLDAEVHEGRRQTGRQQAHAGSRLKPLTILGRPRLTGQPSSRTGENPPYGMRGGIEETSASCEARSAPRSYPTGGESQQWLSYPTNPHVRFDERGRETGCCRMAQATAPVLDSTVQRPAVHGRGDPVGRALVPDVPDQRP